MNDLLKGLNVFLIGMMGVGKTTVGRQLARQLG
ncbi:MAG TPA: shikimate kinase, partial [Candidatus Sericytochromatia bacterium]